jgi:hypothetical protein
MGTISEHDLRHLSGIHSANTPDRHHLTTPELLQIGSFAGHKFLKNLDKLLKPQDLRDCSLG